MGSGTSTVHRDSRFFAGADRTSRTTTRNLIAAPLRSEQGSIGVIQAVNVFRVTALFLIGLYMRAVFHDTHVYVAQALVVCVAVALWLYWATRFADAPAH